MFTMYQSLLCEQSKSPFPQGKYILEEETTQKKIAK